MLGRALGAHGLRGEIRVQWLGDGPGQLQRARRVWLGTGPEDQAALPHDVEGMRPGRQGEVRMQLRGVVDREAARALGGLLVLGDPGLLEPLPPGEYYWYELVGCRVEGREGTPIGTILEIWQTGAHDVLVVEGEDGRRRLLPAVRELLLEVHIAERRIVFEVIPGLLDPA